MGDKNSLDLLITKNPELKDVYLFEHLYDSINNGKPIDMDGLPELHDVYFPWSLWALIYANKEKEALNHLLEGIEKKRGQYLNFQQEPLNEPLRKLEEYKLLSETVFDEPISNGQNEKDAKSKALLSEDEQDQYRMKLEQLMKSAQLYQSENITLRSLAEEIDLNANKLSWLLNEVMGKNFNEYINGLRVDAFKTMALNPAYKDYSLLGIALECGFNSKSVFNDFFKKSENMTPSAWIKTQLSNQ